MYFDSNYLTTLIGSVPYTNLAEACEKIRTTVDIPTWPQMVKVSYYENMYAQFTEALPFIVIDNEHETIYFDTTKDFNRDLEVFYSKYLEEDLDFFGLSNRYANGFFGLLEQLSGSSLNYIKGQVTGPVSMGLTVTDQDLKASLYNDTLVDLLIMNAAMNARWQIRKLSSVSSTVIMSVDEPYMASFGSAYINLSRNQVISMLNEVFYAIHNEGGLACIHCCANTDWSVLLATQVDILNLDAYGFVNKFSLYSSEIRQFLDRGGIIAWGIVPNNYEIRSVSSQDLANALRNGINLVSEKAASRGINIQPEEFTNRSLITPACGLGSTKPEIADKVLAVLAETGLILKNTTI